MAARHADHPRTRYDDRGGRTPPRRDRERDRDYDRARDREERRYEPYSRDDRRRRYERYDDRREYDRRDRDRDRDRRDYYRRSRSRSRSPPRRDRSRDRYRSDRRRRDIDDYPRDRRDRRLTPPPPARDERRRGSSSNAPISREQEEQLKKKDEEAQRQARLAKLETWKKKQVEKNAKRQGSAPASPAASSTPTAVASPAAPPAAAGQLETNRKDPETVRPIAKSTTVKQTKSGKNTFQIDQSAAARPLFTKAAGKPVTAPAAGRPAASTSKSNTNIGSFGLKAKNASEETTSKNADLLDDEENTGKRKLQALPDFVPTDAPSPENPDEAALIANDAMSDDDEANNAEIQAQLEKRREAIANDDTQMKDAPVPAEEASTNGDGAMEVDEGAGAEEEDVDPLDAYMAGLSEAPPDESVPQGLAMFSDEHEPDETAVEAEDFLALAAKKKKKRDIPTVDWSKIELEPFQKNFYRVPAEVQEMSDKDAADLRLELDGIKVKPSNAHYPVVKWAQMGLLQTTLDVFTKLGYKTPTPIQAQAIPIIESGKDLMGVAKTGSGKTLAFGVPLIRHILDQRVLRTADGPIGLIMAPTRELVQQIVNELQPFLKASGLKIAGVFGGAPISEHIGMIKRGGIHVLCATPGRLIDLLQSNQGRVLGLRRITYMVLDEADRMMDMGFEPQIRKITDQIRPDRQAILFSATFPKNMAALARKVIPNHVEVIVGGRSVVPPEIDQIITLVKPGFDKKLSQLLLHLGRLFSEDENAQALIFVERQETAENLLLKMIRVKYGAVRTIHGAQDQADRTETINDFKQGVLPMLIATSVAARGLDVPGLAMVFNFDCPTHLEDYVHRCGRTGRAGNKGTAITLLENPGQERFAVHIAKALKQSDKEIPSDVQSMADIFNEKVKRGDVKWIDGGFGGKGLDKLDQARLLEKRREKRAHKIEGEDDDSEEEIQATAKKAAPEAPGQVPQVPQITPNGEVKDTTNNDGPSYMNLLNSKIVVNKTERTPAPSDKNLTPRERAMMAASKVDGRLSKKGTVHAGQPIDNKGPDAGLFHSTVEINDFPQKARWAVTNRTNVAKILESTGVSITTKGTFYAPGKEPGENELPKLYILVEGDTENVVTTAMMELYRLLREGTLAAEETASRAPTGRYSVV